MHWYLVLRRKVASTEIKDASDHTNHDDNRSVAVFDTLHGATVVKKPHLMIKGFSLVMEAGKHLLETHLETFLLCSV